MGREKGVGALEFAEGLMVMVYGGVLVKGGKVFLSIFLLWWESFSKHLSFGKSRFLKGWHFLCGQQLMVRF